jgi:hypothetical protein
VASCGLKEDGSVSDNPYSAYVEASKRIWSDAYPDLFFGSPGRSSYVRIEVGEEPVRFIRCSVRHTSVLHLHHIEIFAEGESGLVNIAPQAALDLVSTWPGTDVLVSQRTFLRDHGGAYGFHTDVADGPWVAVALKEEAQVRHVRVHNRTDAFAFRAWGLVVETSRDGEAWTTLYDQEVRQEHFAQAVLERSRYVAADGIDPQVRAMLDNMLAWGWAPKKQERFLLDATLPPAERGLIHAAVNRGFLYERNVERTGHGIMRTFRFWSDAEKTEYVQRCMWLVDTLEGWGFAVCFGYGAVLGVLRSQDLIPHDDDIDIIVSAPRDRYPTIAAMMADIAARLEQGGSTIRGNYRAHRHVQREGWANSVDLFFGFAEGPHVSWFPGPRHALLADAVFPPIDAELCGVPVKLPRNPFHYVSTVYGASWARPQPGWSHSWDVTEYADWFDTPPEANQSGL